MIKSQKLFRYIWRVNAVVILLAAGGICVGLGFLLIDEFGRTAARYRQADAGIPVADATRNVRLSLARVSMVEGTNVMRAELHLNSPGDKFSGSSGYGTETRNILFIQPGEKAARWLLPDNEHIISDTSDIREEKPPHERRLIATAALVRPSQDTSRDGTGRLLLFDAAGSKIVEVADNVRDIHIATLSGDDLSILYERDKQLVLAAFDPRSLSKRREQQIEVPRLK